MQKKCHQNRSKQKNFVENICVGVPIPYVFVGGFITFMYISGREFFLHVFV